MGETTLGRRRWWADFVGIGWLVIAAVAVMAPALRPGASLGPFDLLSHFGLTFHAGVHPHNAVQSDQIEQFVPWTDLAWRQVHAGIVPLWNPDSITGMPLAFNWQSGVFSLPMAVAYLVPLHMAYAVTVLVRLVVAGTGAYALCRALGLRPMAATFAGVAFELSGPIVDHSGWPMVGVMAFSGWVLTGVVLVLRGRRPLASSVLLAVSVALAVLGGHPESLVITALVTVVFLAVVLGVRPAGRAPRPMARTAFVGLGVFLGAALGAPLLLPGIRLGVASTRGNGAGGAAFSFTHVANVLGAFQGVDFRTTAYLGPIVLALAVLGARTGWARAEVRALVAVAAVTAVLTFVAPVDGALNRLPGLRAVTWSRAVMLMALATAVLGAFGMAALKEAGPALLRWATWTLSACGFGLVVVALWGALGVSAAIRHHLGGVIGPAVEIVVGLALLSAPSFRTLSPRLRSGLASAGAHAPPILLVMVTAVLVGSGVTFWSVRQGYFPQTAGTVALQADAGRSLVGVGTCTHATDLSETTLGVGIRADANVAYDVREFWVYDPIMPSSYYRAWQTVSGRRVAPALFHLGIFCAPITTAAEARAFGIGYVLEPAGTPGPVGTVAAGEVGSEGLFRVPGSSRATLTPLPAAGGPLPWSAPGRAVGVDERADGSWRMTTDTGRVGILRMRLTASPGWQATLDGRPLRLSQWADGAMLEAEVPAGHHVVVVRYWPPLFSAGLWAALGAALVCAVLLVVSAVRSRRDGARGNRPASSPTAASTPPSPLHGTAPGRS